MMWLGLRITPMIFFGNSLCGKKIKTNSPLQGTYKYLCLCFCPSFCLCLSLSMLLPDVSFNHLVGIRGCQGCQPHFRLSLFFTMPLPLPLFLPFVLSLSFSFNALFLSFSQCLCLCLCLSLLLYSLCHMCLSTTWWGTTVVNIAKPSYRVFCLLLCQICLAFAFPGRPRSVFQSLGGDQRLSKSAAPLSGQLRALEMHGRPKWWWLCNGSKLEAFRGNRVSVSSKLKQLWWPLKKSCMTRCQIWGTIELHRDLISKVLSEW